MAKVQSKESEQWSWPVMVDLEFLDMKPSAAILQIGMVRMNFEQGILGDTFFLRVDAGDCMNHGLTVGLDTLRWWVDQDIKVLRDALARTHDPKEVTYWNPLHLAMVKAANFLMPASDPCPEVWSCGSKDEQILEWSFRKVNGGAVLPWNPRKWYDYRTMRDGFLQVEPPKPILPAHNALNDAKYQALHLIAIKQYIRGLTSGKKVKPAVVDDEL